MSDQRVTVDQMADVIMDGLLEYAELATDTMKDCVKKAGNTVKKETQANAPVKSGRYKKSWAVKRQKETSTTLEMVVHSRNRYQLTHLLEKGHAKRGGGRVKAMRISVRQKRRASGCWRIVSERGCLNES